MDKQAIPEHNDWPNDPTLDVYLWLSNDQVLYGRARDAVERNVLRDLVEEITEEETTGMSAELVGWALSYVDWEQLEELFVAGPKTTNP